MSRPNDLARLLAELDAEADLPHRHLWLIHLLEWVRGDRDSVPGATARLQLFLDAVEARPELRARLQAWWAQLVDTVDITTLLADFGFAPRTAFVSELAARLRTKWLPGTPDTIDASELFVLAVPHEFDAQWMAALDEAQLNRLAALLVPPGEESGLSLWRHALLNAITYCAGQILSTGFAPELRLRMSEEAREAQPFHALIRDVESLRAVVRDASTSLEGLLSSATASGARDSASAASTTSCSALVNSTCVLPLFNWVSTTRNSVTSPGCSSVPTSVVASDSDSDMRVAFRFVVVGYSDCSALAATSAA